MEKTQVSTSLEWWKTTIPIVLAKYRSIVLREVLRSTVTTTVVRSFFYGVDRLRVQLWWVRSPH
jgi:hypothetical protein